MAISRNRGSLTRKFGRPRRTIRRKTPGECKLAFEPLEDRRMLSLTIPAHNSRPGAFQSLYLDFVGSVPLAWSNSVGNFTARGPNSSASAPAPIPAFSTDGDFNNFSAAELATIDHIWQWVSEKYSPFSINVTTVDPGFVQDGRTMTCIIAGSDSDWYNQGAGGTSSIGGFHDSGPNTCFVFSADALANGGPGATFERFIGESAAHEAGHEVGLVHERAPGIQYYSGDSNRAPIMGGSSTNTTARGLWWRTNNFSGQNSTDPIQDELLALTQDNDRLQFATHVGGGILPFDAGGTVHPVSGIINSVTDIDGFSFTATAARATFTISNAQYGGMLAPNGNIVISGSQTQVPATITLTNTSASISTSGLVVGGHYVLQVFSQGQYGDLGQYTVTGSQQQAFVSYDATSRQVNVSGLVGNNNVTLSVDFSNNQYQLLIQDSVNGGATLGQEYLLANVDSVNVNLGAGDDTLNCVGLFKQDANSTNIPVFSTLGGGFDTLKIGGGSTFETFNVGQVITDISFAGVRTASFWNFDAERFELHGSTAGSNTFNVNSQNEVSTIYAYGAGGGSNKCVIGPDVMASSDPSVFFYGSGSANTLELDGSRQALNQSFVLLGNIVQRFVPTSPFASETHYDSNVQTISIKGGGGSDDFLLLSLAAGQTLNAIGNGGDDTFHVGKSNNGPFPYPYTANILGTINVVGGAGYNLLNVDDVASSGFFNGFTINATSFFNQNTTGKITFDSTLQKLDFHASNHGSQFVTLAGLPAATTLNLFGGTGLGDTLIVDDHALAVAPFRVDLGADYYKEYYGTAQNPTIRQVGQTSGFENFRVTANSNTTAINVMAVPTGVSTQVTAGSHSNAVTVYPHDAGGNLTINGDLSIFEGGGSAPLVIDDTGQSNPIDYVFTNTFGIVDRINGLGVGTLAPGSDLQNIIIKAGDGDDTFDFNQHKVATGVTIYGGSGNDMLNFGGGDLVANIANLPKFLYDGQDGVDTFNLNNASQTDQWTYTAASNLVYASRNYPAAAYLIELDHANVEQLAINAGPNSDVVQLVSVAAGETLSFFGGDGNDALTLPSLTSSVLGPVYFYGQGSAGTGNYINSIFNSNTTGQVVHLDQSSLGAFPGDTFFGPGGALYFDSTQSIVLTLGSGVDTVYAMPDPATMLTIRGGGPAGGAGSASFVGSGQGGEGDFLGLAFATAENPVFTSNGAGAGTYSFDNAAPLSFTGFESTDIDDLAPYIVGQSYDDSVIPTINVEFSEDVSNALSLGYFELINTTTAEQVPLGYLNLAYDAGTNIASFTFPGYVDGILPAGDYTATILSTLPDLFGNQIGVQPPLSFTVATPPVPLPGDYNLDNVVNAADYVVWRHALGDVVTPYSGADGDGNGLVDQADYDVWRSNFGQAAGAGSGSPQPIQSAGTPTQNTFTASSQEPTLAAAIVATPESLPVERLQTTLDVAANTTLVESINGIAAVAILDIPTSDESLATSPARTAANSNANLRDLSFASLAPSAFAIHSANRRAMAESDTVPTAVGLAPAADGALLLLTPEINNQIFHFESDLFGSLPEGSHSTDFDVSLFAVDEVFSSQFEA